MIPYGYDRVISRARNKAQALADSVGTAPRVDGLCPLEDSCDQCRAARKGSARYMAYVYAGWAGMNILEYVRTMSDIESRMGDADQAQWDKFYADFTKEFDELYAAKSAEIQNYLKQYPK